VKVHVQRTRDVRLTVIMKMGGLHERVRALFVRTLPIAANLQPRPHGAVNRQTLCRRPVAHLKV